MVWSVSLCRREDNLPHVAKRVCLCLACKMNGMLEREREKRNIGALTPQFEMKCGLEWGEFARVANANFVKWMYQPSIKTLCGRKKERVKIFYLLVENTMSEDMIFVSDHLDPFHSVPEQNILFNDISTFPELYNVEAILIEKQ